jgi:putative endonuclease
MAYRRLQREGYRIVARNYHARNGRGEIDLIGWDGDKLACIEVKTRRNADFGRPEDFVNREKRGHLIHAARDYARRARVDPALLRFDIVAVTLEPELGIDLYKDDFSERSERKRGRRRV